MSLELHNRRGLGGGLHGAQQPQFEEEQQRYQRIDVANFPNPNFWIDIPQGSELLVKPGAMLAYKNLDIETGIARNCCRRYWCGTNELLVNTFTGKRGGGMVMLEEDRLGQIASQVLQRGQGMVLRHGAFLASTSNVELKPQFGGLSGLFDGIGGATYMKADVTDEDPGVVYFKTNAGVIKKIAVTADMPTYIDNNNLVGYTDGLRKSIQKTGGLATSIFGGEGLVGEFSGNGTVFVGSNDRSSYYRASSSKE